MPVRDPDKPVLVEPVLCVDIGATSTKAGYLRADGKIQPTASIPSKPDAGSYFANLTQLISETADKARSELQENVTRLGVSVAGFLDDHRSYLLYNSNLTWLERFPLRQELAKAFPAMRVELEIDSNAATMAEYAWGTGGNYKRFLCVTSGTGLGVGMTVDGKPLRFSYGCMGDIGHVIVQRNGPLCTCGGRGCAEILVSAPVLAERYRHEARLEKKVTLRDVIEAATLGDSIAVSTLRAAGEWLGLAIASMANILFPDHISVAGGLSAAGDYVLKPAWDTFQQSACVAARSRTQLTKATLGPLAPLIGAAWPFWSTPQ